jgi:site-specific recombinase XerD
MGPQQLSFFDPPKRSSVVDAAVLASVPPATAQVGVAGTPATPSLATCIPLYKNHLLQLGKTLKTLAAFSSDLAILANYLGAQTPLTDISRARLDQFLSYVRNGRNEGKPCAPKTLDRRITTLKSFFAWAKVAGYITVDPAAPILHQKSPISLPDFLTEEETHRVLAEVTRRRDDLGDVRAYLLVTLLLTTGIKKGEALAIEEGDIDPSAGTLLIRYSAAHQKHKQRKLRLPDDFAATLAKYRETHVGARLFAFRERRPNKILEEIGAAAGLQRTMTFEMLRWTCAVREFRRGMPPSVLKDKLGLSDITWEEDLPKLQQITGIAH